MKSGRILLEAWEDGDSTSIFPMTKGTWRDPRETGTGFLGALYRAKDGRVLMMTRTGAGRSIPELSADGGSTGRNCSLRRWWNRRARFLSRVPATGDLLAIWNHNPGGGQRTP